LSSAISAAQSAHAGADAQTSAIAATPLIKLCRVIESSRVW
jgi:hypothetical protein